MKNKNMICRVIGAIMILVGVVLFALSIKVNSGYGYGFRFVRWLTPVMAQGSGLSHGEM